MLCTSAVCYPPPGYRIFAHNHDDSLESVCSTKFFFFLWMECYQISSDVLIYAGKSDTCSPLGGSSNESLATWWLQSLVLSD